MSQDQPKLPDAKLTVRVSPDIKPDVFYENGNLKLSFAGGSSITLEIRKRGTSFAVRTNSSPFHIVAAGKKQIINFLIDIEFKAEKIIR